MEEIIVLQTCECGCGKITHLDIRSHKPSRFISGHNGFLPNSGQFKKGQHWRKPKKYWNKKWLYHEYVVNKKSASEISKELQCTDGNIYYFLKKHNIKTRTISETRKIKHWGVSDEKNPFVGKKGELSYNWKGGISPERQSFYSQKEWEKTSGKIRKRDKRTCQKCGNKYNGIGTKFHIHHIISFRNKKLRLDPNNLILLCKNCHEWVHSRKNKNKEFLGKDYYGYRQICK